MATGTGQLPILAKARIVEDLAAKFDCEFVVRDIV